MKHILKRISIFFGISIMILAILLGSQKTTSIAFSGSRGDKITITGSDVLSAGYYCRNKNMPMHLADSGVYTVDSIATIGANTSITGAMTAYILANSNGYGSSLVPEYASEGQKALWELIHGGWETSTRPLTVAARNYAYSDKTPNISNNLGEPVITNNKEAGPFNFKFTGAVSSLSVTDIDGKNISGIQILDENKNVISASQIQSDHNFYVKNDTDQRIGKLNIDVYTNVITATVYYLSMHMEDNPDSSVQLQDLLAANTGTAPIHKSITVDVKTTANLNVYKADEDSKENLEMKFIVGTSKGFLKDTENNTYKYDASRNEATVFETSNGFKKIEELEYDTFTIYEIEIGNDRQYLLEDQEGYDETNKWVKLVSVEVDGKITEVPVHTVNRKTTGNLTIKKADAENNDPLNMGFIIEDTITIGKNTITGFVTVDSEGKWKYDSTEAEARAKPFRTEGGQIKLEDLHYGTYKIYEVEAPEGYVLSDQESYGGKPEQVRYDKDKNWVYLGEVTINRETTKNNSIEVPAFEGKNIKKISIGGYVWKDIPETKANETNSLYDSFEKKVSNVKVRLMKKDGTEVASQYTKEDGSYFFEKLMTQGTVQNYYVEFDYSGLGEFRREYKDESGNTKNFIDYIPVAYNATATNGSRAIVKTMPEKEIDFKGIATTYPESKQEETYGLKAYMNSNLFNKETNTIEYMNLGIRKLKETDYDIDENLYQVKIVMKGYTYTYKYGREGNDQFVAAPTVRWQGIGDIKAYLQPIYPSDVTYEAKNAKNDLKVYVVYKIGIHNTTTYNVEELYREEKLMVTKLTNKYDTNRYTLNKEDGRWKDDKNTGTATMTNNYLQEVYGNGIAKDKNVVSYIEFEVKRDAILEILNTTKNPDGILEKFPTEVTSVAHHIYTRKDYSWDNKITADQTHQTPEKVKQADAPYLIFRLGEERKISGTVFEDGVVTTNGEILGDGKFDKENVVKDVKVDLLDVDQTVSSVYGLQYKDYIQASTQITDTKGQFTFTGVVPGDYYLRFTYGDGTQKIITPTGEVAVLSKDYKSTIVTSDSAKKAIQGIKDNDTVKQDEFVTTDGESTKKINYIWYRNLKGDNYSVAVDNIQSRKEANVESTKNVLARTPLLSITIENDGEISADVDQKAKYDENNKEIVQPMESLATATKSIFKGFNFGIIVEPKQKMRIDKVITNVKLTNGDNQVLFDGNPEIANIQEVTDLDGISNKGSTYTRAEVDEASIYGSTVEIAYGIKVTNISDVNYYGEKYYWFGDSKDAYEVTLKVDEVTDYLENALELLEVDNNGKKVELTTESADFQDGDNTRKTVKVKITGWNTLYTEKNENRKNDKKPTSDTAYIKAKKIFAQGEDTQIINEAEITGAENDSEPEDNNKVENIKTIPTIELDHQKARAVVTITPPTGADKMSPVLYILTGAIALAVLSAGIVVIKKKIL